MFILSWYPSTTWNNIQFQFVNTKVKGSDRASTVGTPNHMLFPPPATILKGTGRFRSPRAPSKKKLEVVRDSKVPERTHDLGGARDCVTLTAGILQPAADGKLTASVQAL